MAGIKESDEEQYYRSLREYSRVDAYLPLQIRELSADECNCLRSRVELESALTEHPEMPEHEDKLVAECFRILNAKLDSIIRLLTLETKNYKELKLELVNISAGGLSTSTSTPFEPADMVEIRLMLPFSQFSIFYIYGKVVKCEPVCERFQLSVAFTVIDEGIREQIAKYVFERQREILRKKRRP